MLIAVRIDFQKRNSAVSLEENNVSIAILKGSSQAGCQFHLGGIDG